MSNMEFERDPGSTIRPSDPKELAYIDKLYKRLTTPGNPEYENRLKELQNAIEGLEVNGTLVRFQEVVQDFPKENSPISKALMRKLAEIPGRSKDREVINDYLET